MSDDKTAAKGKDAPAAAKGKDAQKPAPAEGDKSAGKKRNPKRLIIIVAAALVLLGGAATAFFLLRPAPSASEDVAKTGGAEKTQVDKNGKSKEKKGDNKKPYFVDLETFTVNLKDPEKFLQIKLTFQVKTVEAAETLKDLMPIVRSSIIPVLGAQEPAALMTPEGKEKLSNEVVEAANKALAGGELADTIDAVLITHMIIQ